MATGAAHAACDALAERFASGVARILMHAIRKDVAMLLESVQCAEVRLNVFGQ